MQRAVKISLGLATATKLRRLDALRREIQSCTQAYVNSAWTTPGKLDAATLGRVSGGSVSPLVTRCPCVPMPQQTPRQQPWQPAYPAPSVPLWPPNWWIPPVTTCSDGTGGQRSC